MEHSHAHAAPSRLTSALVRQRIEKGGERLWRFEDFSDQPFPAVAKALSRLTQDGMIERLSKGTYYRTRETAFGKSRPNPAHIQKLASKNVRLFPAGVTAANLLGFSTQNPKRNELATCASSVPRKLIGMDTIVHTRRPQSWEKLSELDAALLDFLRNSGKTGEFSARETVEKTLSLLWQDGRYQRLAKIAADEPPRVRAMLGALGEMMGADRRTLSTLHSSLNALSRFDFGVYSALPNAKTWCAKNITARE
jgi:hypothetical protein